MHLSSKIKNILDNYSSDNPGTKANLARILMHGKLAGTGKLVILPVDQGFEHGPARSFAPNPDGYDPEYHIKLAIESGLNAYAAPLGMLEAVASSYAGTIPLILKVNSSNSLKPETAGLSQAITASGGDALRLGCSAIGFTIYPGSAACDYMMEDLRELSLEAKACGLAVVVWSYARGEELDKKDETALDVISYAAHLAALLGAHIIKVKPPEARIALEANKKAYEDFPLADLSERIKHIKQSCFAGKRLVIFSGGNAKSSDEVLAEITAIHQGGGDGSIIGRNAFQRSNKEAKALLEQIINIYNR